MKIKPVGLNAVAQQPLQIGVSGENKRWVKI
jgi:hypothetical protein